MMIKTSRWTMWMMAATLGAPSCGQAPPPLEEPTDLDEARVYKFVPPNPREADSITGDIELAVIYAELDGFGPKAIDPQDLRTVLGNPSQGGIHNVEPPPFIQVAPYFEDISYGQLSITPTVFETSVQLDTTPSDYCDEGVETIALGPCNIGDVQRAVLDASVAQLGLNLDAYDAFLIVLDGMSTPGIAKHSLTHGRVERRVAMIRDVEDDLGYDAQPAATSLKSLMIHELSHALGDMKHAAHWYCLPDVAGPDPYDPLLGCHDVANVDPWSPVGAYATRGLSAYDRSLWGFLEREQTYWAFSHLGHFQDVELDALELTSSGLQEIRVPIDDDLDTFYSVEYRRPIGVDAAPLTANEALRFVNLEEGDIIDGLVVRLRSDGIGDAQATDLANQGEAAILYQLVTPDEPFYDPYSHISLSVEPRGDQAVVTVGVNVLLLDPVFGTR